MCLDNIPKDFKINNIEKAGLKGIVNFFSVDFDPIDNNDVLNIQQYLMKGIWYKVMFGIVFKKCLLHY